MIRRLPALTREAYNPIRPHINIQFERLKNENDSLIYIADHLREKLDEEVSRVLVFVRTRKKAEQAAEELAKLLPGLKGKVSFFHAGLGADERKEIASDFGKRQGRISVLCTTKAFGMGMDIPNIHYVFHLGPSATFEDFLQEVGRAGRNRDALLRAGLSEQNPIRTICLLTNDDFPRLRDLLQRTQLSWSQVQDLFASIKQLFAEHKLSVEETLPLPLTYYTQVDTLAGDSRSGGDSTNFRLALHWLERLRRIELGYFLPAHLEFDNGPLKKYRDNYRQNISDPLLITLFELLLNCADLDHPYTVLSLSAIKAKLGLRTNTSVFKVIAFGQQTGYVKLRHSVKVTIPAHRQDEIKYASGNLFEKHPDLEIMFRLAEQFISYAKLGKEVELDSEATNQDSQTALEDLFTTNNFPWLKPQASSNSHEPNQEWVKKVRKAREGFAKRGRGGYARGLNGVFYVIRSVPGVRHRIIFKEDAISQLIQRSSGKASKDKKELADYLSGMKKDCYHLLNRVYEGNRNATNFSLLVTEVLNEIRQPDIRYLETMLNLLSRTRLIQIEGSLLRYAS